MPPHHDPARAHPLTVIGIGANLGDRLGAIELAIRAIEALPETEVVGRSSVWRTRPLGGPPQPDYYNAAVGIRSALPAHDLMDALLVVEALLGRVRGEPNAPRTLDLDILWIDGQIIAPPPARDPGNDALGLRVPHPRLRERAFALIPMLEVVGDAADPETGRLYAEILAEIGTEGVAPLDSTDA